MPKLPTFIEPCSPKAAKTPPKGEAWVYEAKWDGYRCLVVKDGKSVRLYSRNRTEWTDRLPGIASSFASFGARSEVMDGELCVCDAEGRPDFRALHRTMRERRPDESRLVYYAFDLLHANGADLTSKPLIARKRKLDALAEREPIVPNLFLVEQFNDADLLMKYCRSFGLEGIVCKRRDSRYTSGECRDWLKVKCPEWKARSVERWRLFEGKRGSLH